MASFGALLADAMERGLVATNVVRSMKKERTRKSKREQRQKLKVGIHIPTPDEIKRLIPHLPDKYRPLLLTAIFTGLRASELRGELRLRRHSKANRISMKKAILRYYKT